MFLNTESRTINVVGGMSGGDWMMVESVLVPLPEEDEQNEGMSTKRQTAGFAGQR